ncbi:F1F0 ATPase [Dyadobacter frigoris]|uniref:ATP synthase subunit I n=1 Tax=Dyadobacter frigoris TaxID=2576211 RepID=UPI0024A20D39|nr:ATP synthase subunit I [Dyadobacter frigoris]GLU57268.1 F1F0 ATPase [Dyadobacter frigoris]
MREIINEYVALAFLVGLILGSLYFGGLWLTVRHTMASRFPAAGFLVSYVLRTAVVLAGFYYVGIGGWQGILICLAGFVLARYLVIYATKKEDDKQKLQTKLDKV